MKKARILDSKYQEIAFARRLYCWKTSVFTVTKTCVKKLTHHTGKPVYINGYILHPNVISAKFIVNNFLAEVDEYNVYIHTRSIFRRAKNKLYIGCFVKMCPKNTKSLNV